MNVHRSNSVSQVKSALYSGRKRPNPTPIDGLAQEFSERLLNQMAVSAATQRQFGRAMAALNELVARHPREAKYYCNRGLVHFQAGRTSEALADFNQAIQLQNSLDQAFNNRANCRAVLGNVEGAIADYSRAIDLNPFNIKARINLAVTWRELERYDDALAALDEALMFHRLSGPIYAQLGRTYHLRGDWNAAIANYTRALDALSKDQGAEEQRLRQQVSGWRRQLESNH